MSDSIRKIQVAALREPKSGFRTQDDIVWSCTVEASSEEEAISSAYEIAPMQIVEVYDLEVVVG